MKILVTGSSGFVGRHLVADLRQNGHEIILADRHTEDSSSRDCANGKLRYLKLDITDYSNCLQAIQSSNPDAIIHLAGIAQTTGQDTTKLESINVQGTKNIATAAIQGLKVIRHDSIPFLFISTSFVYGGGIQEGRHFIAENSPVMPRGAYGESKLAAERELQNLNSHLLKIYIARPFNHIGPGQHPSFVVPGICSRIRKAESHSEIETGNMDAWRDFTDVRDVVRAYRLIIEKQPPERLFVIGSGQGVKIQTIFDKLNQLSGKNLRQKLAVELKRDEGTAALLADISLARRTLSWVPEISLDQSLRAAWNEYQ